MVQGDGKKRGMWMATKSKIRIVSVCTALTIFLAGASSIPLAGQATTAAILGAVTDPTGAAAPGATVTVTNTGTGIAQSTLSDERGRLPRTQPQCGTV